MFLVIIFHNPNNPLHSQWHAHFINKSVTLIKIFETYIICFQFDTLLTLHITFVSWSPLWEAISFLRINVGGMVGPVCGLPTHTWLCALHI